MSGAAATAPPGRRARGRVAVPARIGLVLLAIVLLLVVGTPFWPGYDPYGQDLMASLAPPLGFGGEAAHPLGTDALGRDVLSRVALAGRISIAISLAAVLIGLGIGAALGLAAGFFGGVIDSAVTALADLQLSIPRILLLVAAAALIGPSSITLTLLLGITGWVAYGRVARAVTLTLRDREFVLAAITQGAGPGWNIRKHLLPNVMPQLLIMATFDLGQIIVLEASMSYLGLGVQPPVPSWGGMISDGQNFLELASWIALCPGVAVFLLVSGVQLLSQAVTAESRIDPEVGGRGWRE